MGSHAGCGGGVCESTGRIYLIDVGRANLFNFMGVLPALPSAVSFDVRFNVGVNQITLADHGCQEYSFLPEVRGISHEFRNVTASTVRGPLYRAEARLNPAAGVSRISFRPVSEDQEGFFPAYQRVELFVSFAFDVPLLALVGRRRVTAFNKTPLVYETAEPLTGFPPLNGPELVLQDDVRMFDLARPDEASILVVSKGSRIQPENRVLYDIDATEAVVAADGSFTSHVTVRLNEDVGPVRTAIALLPTRGVSLTTPELQQVRLHREAFSFDVVGRIDDPDEPHLEVTVRPYSVEYDSAKVGFGRRDIPLPERHDHGPRSLHIHHPAPKRVRAGQRERLDFTPEFGSEVTSPEYVWIAPHSITLDDPSAARPSFVAPAVTRPTDIWFTLYVRDGSRVSPPYKFEYVVEP